MAWLMGASVAYLIVWVVDVCVSRKRLLRAYPELLSSYSDVAQRELRKPIRSDWLRNINPIDMELAAEWRRRLRHWYLAHFCLPLLVYLILVLSVGLLHLRRLVVM